MTPFSPKLSFRLFRAIILGLLGLSLLVGLAYALTVGTRAQTGPIVVPLNQAQVRYREGVEFKVNATISGSEVNRAQLKVKYGKRGREETYTAKIASGSATYMIYDEAQSLASGMPLTYSWILSDGQVQLQTNPQTVIYEDTQRTWYQREGPQVTIRWYNGDNSYGNLMYQLAADTLGTYKRRFNIDPQDQIYITIYGSSASYHSTFPDVPEWSGGFSRYGGVEIVAIAPQDHNSSIFIGEGIPHELSHAAIYQFLQTPAPRWLDEGFAVYNQNIISIKEYDHMLQQAYRTDTLIPLSELNNRWPLDETMARLAYAEGRSIVTFLINSYSNEVWSNILDQLRRQPVDGAFIEVFGVTLAQMEDIWKSNVLGGGQLPLPAARRTGPVHSQPTAQDFAAKSASNQAQSQVKKPVQADDGLLLMLLGIALGGVLVLVVLSVIVVRNRHREAALYRFMPRPVENENYHRITAGVYPANLPPALLPVSGPLPHYQPVIYPAGVPHPVGYSPLSQGFNISPPQTPYANLNSSLVPASSSDPFDFISARFDPKTPGSTNYSAGAFLNLDPYGLNFDKIEAEGESKKRPV